MCVSCVICLCPVTIANKVFHWSKYSCKVTPSLLKNVPIVILANNFAIWCGMASYSKHLGNWSHIMNVNIFMLLLTGRSQDVNVDSP